MRHRDNNPIDPLRRGRSEIENHYIDEYAAGRIGRREFLRKGSVIGMSAPLLGAIVAACGSANRGPTSSATSAAPAKIKSGGSLTLSMEAPTSQVNPVTTPDTGLTLLQQTGEFLVLDSIIGGGLKPVLATKWSPLDNGRVWRFSLRQGVKFSDGRSFSADDVVYSIRALADPHNASNALSVFQGLLQPDGVKRVDNYTVDFHLESAIGDFPYLVSSDNYNAIIVPEGTDFTKWHKTFVGTGPFKLDSYDASSSASFVPNPTYWGPQPHLAHTNFKFYQGDQQTQIIALQGGSVDVISDLNSFGAQALLHNPTFEIVNVVTSQHRELSMRTDLKPFSDKRVRQAVALTLNRPALVSGILYGYGSIANDYPFGPRFKSTDTTVPQRHQDLGLAKHLLSEAGYPNGFATNLFTENYVEIPTLAQALQADAAKAGVKINLHVESQSAYYGKASFGQSDWLDGAMSLVDYGDRGVPNVFLGAPLTSNGSWNAARFKNPTYDGLVRQFVAAVDLQSQRRIAGQIQRLLLDETPIIFPYWFNRLTVSVKGVGGMNPTGAGQLFLGGAYRS